MSILKRVISLIIVISMLVVPSAFAAEENNAYYEKTTAKLEALGMWGFENEPSDNMNRAQFAQLLSNLMGRYGEVLSDTSFADVEKDSKYYAAICFMKACGIMNGTSENTFSPEKAITVNEAVKAIVTALGYDVKAENIGGYPNGYIAVASQLKFIVGDRNLSFYDAALMAEHALEINMASVISISDKEVIISSTEDGTKTLLSEYNDIYHVKGQMTDNGITQLYGETEVSENQVKIGGKVFYTDDVNIKGFIGGEVDFYYKEEAGLNKVLYCDYASDKANTIVIKAEDLETDDPSFSKTNIVYNNGKTKVRAKVISRPAFIYNSVSYPTYTLEDFKIPTGTLTLTDGDGNGVYDVVVADVYKSFQVKTIGLGARELCDALGNSVKVADYEKVEVIDATGKVRPLSDIAVLDVVSVFESKNKEYLKIIFSEEMTTQILNGMYNEDGEYYYTFGEKEYTLAKNFKPLVEAEHHSLEKLALGAKYRVYLDFNNQIAGYVPLTSLDLYAYLLKLGSKSSNVLEPTDAVLELKLQTGEHVEINCAKKVFLNGQETEREAVLTHSDFYKNGTFVDQLIKIRTNKKGEISHIETAPSISTTPLFVNTGCDPTRFTMVLSSASGASLITDSRYYVGAARGSISPKYGVGPETILFVVPADRDPDSIMIYTGNKEIAESGNMDSANIKVYDADTSHCAGVIVADAPTDATKARYKGYFAVVKDIKYVKDTMGDYVKQLCVYYFDWDNFKYIEAAPDVFPEGLKQGDFIRFATDSNEKISHCQYVLSTRSENGEPITAPFVADAATLSSTTNIYKSILYGYPCGVSSVGASLAIDEAGKDIWYSPFYGSMTNFHIYNVKDNTIETTKATQIPVSAELNAVDGSFDVKDKNIRILITTNSGGAYDVWVINFGETISK